MPRHEYLLTPAGGDEATRDVLLNDVPLALRAASSAQRRRALSRTSPSRCSSRECQCDTHSPPCTPPTHPLLAGRTRSGTCRVRVLPDSREPLLGAAVGPEHTHDDDDRETGIQ